MFSSFLSHPFMFAYLIISLLAWLLGIAALIVLLIRLIRIRALRKIASDRTARFSALLIIIAFLLGLFSTKTYPPHFAMPPWMQSYAPHGTGPELPLVNAFRFLLRSPRVERIADISANPNAVPSPIERTTPEIVDMNLTAKEVIAEVAPGIFFNYWTYNGQVPGPMLRVRVGDTVRLSLTNDPSSLHAHNIDLHAVTGPGGGATLTNVAPGETKTFQWKALNPGLYVYHCATMNVSTHNAHGQYGLILVEPEEGLPVVDKEFYLVQGELYTSGGIGRKGLVSFDSQALVDGNPSYVTFNGKIPPHTAMEVKRGEKVRIYVGNGGVNLISSFHVIGEIFDTVYPEGAIGSGSAIFKNVQTTIVPAGGATIVEFTADVPGTYTLVDHALARMNKGAWTTMKVIGDENREVFSQTK